MTPMQVIRSLRPLNLPLLDLTALWNRGLPAQVRIAHTILWPLLLTPLFLLNQLVTPHPVWVVLLITLLSLYAIAYGWVRHQARLVTLTRRRTGTLLVAGDELVEEFEFQNTSNLPVLWAEFLDDSELPGYNPGRVIGCGGNASYRWNAKMICRQRGVYRLGPHELMLGDPFHLFTLTIAFAESETMLIYPRVLHLPPIQLPQGSSTGSARRQRPLWGVQPAATVRDYQPTDSLRYVHWPITAHRGELMVKELETEPSGAVWVVLDLDQAAHSGQGDQGTLEYSIIMAASVTAQLLNSSEQRAVGLFTIGGDNSRDNHTDALSPAPEPEVIVRQPQRGQAHLWSILAALAPVRPSNTRPPRHRLAERRRSRTCDCVAYWRSQGFAWTNRSEAAFRGVSHVNRADAEASRGQRLPYDGPQTHGRNGPASASDARADRDARGVLQRGAADLRLGQPAALLRGAKQEEARLAGRVRRLGGGQTRAGELLAVGGTRAAFRDRTDLVQHTEDGHRQEEGSLPRRAEGARILPVRPQRGLPEATDAGLAFARRGLPRHPADRRETSE